MEAGSRRSLGDECRAFMSAFPTGVAVVSSIDTRARPRGLTCSSLISVTLAPPTLLVSVHVRSGTLAAIRQARGFGVNLLPARARHIAELFASGRPDRFESVQWRPRGALGLPFLHHDCCGWAECTLSEIFVVGDHALVVGEATEIESTPEVPLLYGFREFSSWHPASTADPDPRRTGTR